MLWIGTFEGLASWNGSKVKEYSEIAGQPVSTLLEDREGTMWVAHEREFGGNLRDPE